MKRKNVLTGSAHRLSSQAQLTGSAHRLSRSYLGVIFLFLSVLFFSCQQEQFNTPTEKTPSTNLGKVVSSFAPSDSVVEYEPSYQMISDIMYEHMLYNRLKYNVEDYLLPESYGPVLIQKYDSIESVYEGMSLDAQLDHLVSEGVMSVELRQAIEDLNAGSQVAADQLAYLEEQLYSESNSNLTYDERVLLRSFIAALIGYFRYYDDIRSMQVDTSNSRRGGVELREEIDCEYTWDEKVGDFVPIIVATISLYKFYKSGDLDNLKEAITVIIPIYGIYKQVKKIRKKLKDEKFCKQCLLRDHVIEVTGNCDNAAYFHWIGGPLTRKVDGYSVKNGYPPTFFIDIDDKILITQTAPQPQLLVVQSKPWCERDGETKYWEGVNHYTIITDLFEEQAKVPSGSLQYLGKSKFSFPKPTSNVYVEYTYEKTEEYDLSGKAFKEAYLDVLGPNGVRENVKSVQFDKTSRKLTVTWAVDRNHWDHFLRYGSVLGKVELEVINYCPDGRVRAFPLIVQITSKPQQEQ